MAGTAHLLNDNTGILRWAQREQLNKGRVLYTHTQQRKYIGRIAKKCIDHNIYTNTYIHVHFYIVAQCSVKYVCSNDNIFEILYTVLIRITKKRIDPQ